MIIVIFEHAEKKLLLEKTTKEKLPLYGFFSGLNAPTDYVYVNFTGVYRYKTKKNEIDWLRTYVDRLSRKK